MDVNKDGDVCVSTVSESSASVGEVGGKNETLAQDTVCEELKQREKVDGGGDGDCNGGEDIMVEVLGSEVFVGGVCSSSREGRSSGDAGKECLHEVEPELRSDGKLVEGSASGLEGDGCEIGGKENVLDSSQGESVERGQVAGGELEMESSRKFVEGCELGTEGAGCEKEGGREDVLEGGTEEAVERGKIAAGDVANSMASGEGGRSEKEAEVRVDGSHVETMLSEPRVEEGQPAEVVERVKDTVGDCATRTAPKEGGSLENGAEVRVIESCTETMSVVLESKIEEGQPVEVKVSPVSGVSEGELVEKITEMDTAEGTVVGKGSTGSVDALDVANLKSKSDKLPEMIVKKGKLAPGGGANATALEAGGSSLHAAESRVSELHMETVLSVLESQIEECHHCDVVERGDFTMGNCANSIAPKDCGSLQNEAGVEVIESHLERTAAVLESNFKEGRPVELKVSPIGQGGVSEGNLVKEIGEMDTAEGSVVGKGMHDSSLVDASASKNVKFNPEGLPEMIVDQVGPVVDHSEDGGKGNDQRDGVPEKEVTNSEAFHSSVTLESSVVSNEVNKNTEDSLHVNDASQKINVSIGGKRLSVAETGQGVQGKGLPCSGNVVMQNDFSEENTCSSAEEHQAVIETEKRVTEDQVKVPTDSNFLCMSSHEVPPGENDAMVSSNAMQDQQSILDECLDSNIDQDHAYVDLKIGQAMELDPDVMNVEKSNIDGSKERANEEQPNDESANMKTDNGAISTPSCQSNLEITRGIDVELVDLAVSDQNVEAPNLANWGRVTNDHDKVPSNSKSLCPPTHEVVHSKNDAIVSSNSVQDQLLLPDECLNDSKGHDCAQVDSSTKQDMEIDHEVMDIEKVGSRGHNHADVDSTDQYMEIVHEVTDVQKDNLDGEKEKADEEQVKDESASGKTGNVAVSILSSQGKPEITEGGKMEQVCDAQVDSTARPDMEIDHGAIYVEKGSSRGHNHAEVDSTGQDMETVHEVINVEKDNLEEDKEKANEKQVQDESAGWENGNVAISVPLSQGNSEITEGGHVEQVCNAVVEQNVEISKLANINRSLSCTVNDKALAPILVCDNDQNSLTNDQGGKELDGNKEVVGHVDALGIDGNKDEANQEQMKDESTSGKTGDGAGSTPSCQGNLEINRDWNAEVVGEAVSDRNVEVSNLANTDGSSSFIENDKTLAPAEVCDNLKDPIADDPGGEAVNDNKAVIEHTADAIGVDVTNSVGNTGTDIMQDGSSDQDKQGEEQAPDEDVDLASSHEGNEMETEDHSTDTEVRRSARQVALKKGSISNDTYVLSEKEGEFSVSDLVWGKIRSHPWWPGQIFDPSDASEKANKYHKKDCLLVAYFGDRTFAWNDMSQLKPFCTYFSQEEKQSNSESFNNAISCALEEVGRRVELGLACSCISKDEYERIKFQIIENAGIRQESRKREGVDESASAEYFEPHKLVEYMKALAQCPKGISSRLGFVIAKAQLSGFYRQKGYGQLPELQLSIGLMESDVENEITHTEDKKHVHDAKHPITPVCDDGEGTSCGQENLKTQKRFSLKRKHNLKESAYSRKKVRSVMDLMGEATNLEEDGVNLDSKDSSKIVSPSSNKKRKCFDSFAEDPGSVDQRKSISVAKVITTTPVPRPSFKIGERLRKVASQMTGSPASESNGEKPDNNEKAALEGPENSLQNTEDTEKSRMAFDAEYSSLNDLLSQLLLAAQDPKTKYSFLNVIVCFFSDFRNSVVPGLDSAPERNGKRKRSSHIGGPTETFEFDDMNDSYWTDRVIENGPEEELSDGGTVIENQLVPIDSEKPCKAGRRPYSRKRHSDSIQELPEEKPVEYIDENAPAELVMVFPQLSPIPAETVLNRMFKRFGPLKESETEIDKEGNRARVVFKKGSDAQVAYNSAGKFNIFGSVLVNYQLSHTISMQFRSSPVLMIEGQKSAMNVIDGGHEGTMNFISEGHEVSMDVMTEGQEVPVNVISEDPEVATAIMTEGQDEVPTNAEIG